MVFVLWRENKPQQMLNPLNEVICDSEESLVATIQNLQIDPQTMRKYGKNLEIRVVPYLEANQMVLNLRKLQTRIVRYTDYVDGTLNVYNTDNPYEVTSRYVPSVPEIWSIIDCIPVDLKKAKEEHNFEVGTEMGTHPKYAEVKKPQI